MGDGRTVAGAATGASAVTRPGSALGAQPFSAFRRPELQGSFQTAALLIVVSAMVVALGRLRRQAGLNDLALACALGLVAASALLFAVVPALAPLAASTFAAWLQLIGFSVACTAFGAVAIVPTRPAERIHRVQLSLAAGVAGAVAATIILSWALRAYPPAGPEAAATGAQAHADPARLGLGVLAAVTDVAAAAAYAGRSGRTGDSLYRWLAGAAVLAAAAQISYLVSPSLSGRVIWAGDGFRLCFYVAALGGLMRDVRSYWMALPEAMVTVERRRIARDLHDGLAQELAYLSRNLDALGGLVEEETLSRLRRATQRARLESRLAVSRLAALDGAGAGAELAYAASEAAKRFGVGLELQLLPGIRLPATRSDALVHIACEAVTNAARHSGAGQVSLSLQREGSRMRLRVCDHGAGFDPAADGFGLRSMRERARAVGGELKISSRPGHGTEVEAVL